VKNKKFNLDCRKAKFSTELQTLVGGLLVLLPSQICSAPWDSLYEKYSRIWY